MSGVAGVMNSVLDSFGGGIIPRNILNQASKARESRLPLAFALK